MSDSLLVVVGTGLMGGSFALAAKAQGLFDSIVGLDPNATRSELISLGIVDDLITDVPANATAVLLATPSDQIAAWVTKLKDHAGWIFDVGSVKAHILQQLHAHIGFVPSNFVPCHPITGSERSGPTAAHASLYVGHTLVLTPDNQTNSQAISAVDHWWQRVGANTLVMQANAHDEALALTSHLPHLIAYAYSQLLAEQPADLPRLTGQGFRDFSRIAGADETIWAPIFQLNRPALLAQLDRFEGQLATIRSLVGSDRSQELLEYLAQARRLRQAGVAELKASTHTDAGKEGN